MRRDTTSPVQPRPDLLARARAANDRLAAEGLEPFDLVGWVYLLDLVRATRDPLGGLDIDVRHSSHGLIVAAARRKAAALDAAQGRKSTFHADVLASMLR